MHTITLTPQTLQVDAPVADDETLAAGFAKEEVKAPRGDDVHMYAHGVLAHVISKLNNFLHFSIAGSSMWSGSLRGGRDGRLMLTMLSMRRRS